MKLSQKGFALIEGLIIFVAISLVSGAGLYVYNSRNEPAQSLASVPTRETKKTTAAKADKNASVKPVTNKNPGFVTISEWGIAVRIGSTSNSDKLTYRLAKDDQGNDTAYFTVRDVPENCREVGFALHRRTSDDDDDKYVKIGDGFYAPSSAPLSLCDKNPGQEKTAELLTRLDESLTNLDFEVKVSN